jgi:DNA polymerase III subunit delta'
MDRAFTRGQPRALAEVQQMVLGQAPHAVLLVGPASIGKTTLALDLAAGLFCNDPDPAARPCRNCRGCRQLASGNHPDLHRLAPAGPGGQIRIGDQRNPEPGTVRHLIGELALLPVEGGARVAIVEAAHRLNDDSQNALLKMLEEPPAGVTIVLCADDEECLLPTVRSRCARIRLAPAAGRDIENWLAELGAADPPQAARLARLAGGAPGLALAYARSPEAERLRGEIARGLLDMATAVRRDRLVAIREMMKSAAALDAALEAGRGKGPAEGLPEVPRRKKGRAAAAAEPASESGAAPGGSSVAGEGSASGIGSSVDDTAESAAGERASPAAAEAASTAKVSASERRSAAAALLDVWASVARDLCVAGLGDSHHLRELALLDELPPAAALLDRAALTDFIVRLGEIGCQLDENVNPELALDVLALSWPRPSTAASAGVQPPPVRR